jgi:diguanylate cyclase (GGDEF)-like protein
MDDLTLDAVIAAAAMADSGVDFVYRLLDHYAEQASSPDTVLVIDDARLGRQLFRAGQRSAVSSDLTRSVAGSPPGIYIEGGQVPQEGSTTFVHLANMALHFDMISQDAARDGLTGLFNRRTFDDFLAQSVGRTQRSGWPFALVILDVDGFKGVNDRLGHASADEVLRAIGTEMRRVLRVGDMAARIGGDEFALVLHDVGEAGVKTVLVRLDDAVASCAEALGVRLSAGFACAPGEGADVISMYRTADRRMYEAKRK